MLSSFLRRAHHIYLFYFCMMRESRSLEIIPTQNAQTLFLKFILTRRGNGKSGYNYSKRISTAAERQTPRGQRSRCLMSSSAKFGFRPRALDVTRRLPIRVRKCRKRSPKVKRSVALAPTGMEKEEEMESHLQQAILAQKATSAGDTVENHVIPTPKVLSVHDDVYDRIYEDRRFQKNKKLIAFNEYVPYFLTQGSYNADSEDEEWLNTKRNINTDDFEHIIAKLEIASQTDIIKPRNARALLQRYDPGLIDDIYDYWLLKRQKAASKNSKCPVLLPRICSEIRREEKAVVNPYIAFRRRLDKVQTRKKQKSELMTYEKFLQISFTMKRSIVMFGAMAQRERLKKMVSEVNYSMFQMQYKRRISNEEMAELIEQVNQQQKLAERKISQMEPSTSQVGENDLSDDVARPKIGIIDQSANGLVDDNFIQRNIELWNAAALITPVHTTPVATDDSAEAEKVAAIDQNSSIDGRYQFKRKHGCSYRAPILSTSSTNLLKSDQTLFPPPLPPSFDELNPFRCFRAKFTREIHSPDGSVSQQVGFMGRRIGRGGRQLIDLYFPPSSSSPPNSNSQISSNL